ncbi:MAG: hypothetical protein Tsb0020_42810 [Haliangiales bacterium]
MALRQKSPAPASRAFQPPPGYRGNDQPLFAAGTVIHNTFQVGALLATTDNGQLFEAYDMLLERPMALFGAWRNDDVPPLFDQVRQIAAVDDPAVASIFGVGYHHEVSFVALERITGPTLRDYVAHYRAQSLYIPPGDVIELLTKLARSLDGLHSARQWAPRTHAGNIVRLPSRRLVLSELAFHQGGLREGSAADPDQQPAVLAPELVAGLASDRDPETAAIAIDLYRLGAVAFELLAGEPLAQTRLQVQRDTTPSAELAKRRPDVSPLLLDVIAELLAERPEQRPPSAASVAAELEVVKQRLQPAMKILIADPYEPRAAHLAGRLQRQSIRVTTELAADSDAALAAIEAHAPDLLLFDLALPGSMNSLELCMYTQGSDAMNDCTLIAIGDSVGPADAAVLEQLGVAQVLWRDSSAEDRVLELARECARQRAEPS